MLLKKLILYEEQPVMVENIRAFNTPNAPIIAINSYYANGSLDSKEV